MASEARVAERKGRETHGGKSRRKVARRTLERRPSSVAYASAARVNLVRAFQWKVKVNAPIKVADSTLDHASAWSKAIGWNPLLLS